MSEQLGRYILDRKIAEGGMAEVFLARQSGPQGYERICVLKRMLPVLGDDSVMVQMFLDEARLAGQLTHPNIAQIYDFGQVGETFYLAMEHVPGCSLRDLIDLRAPQKAMLPFPVVARIIAEAALALDYAHTAVGSDGRPLRVIHRDVSPHNILLSSTGLVKLIDFGIAKATTVRQETVAGTIKGKFAYMSPEQIRGEPMDRRTDIYSLGLVLYELLTNARCLDGANEHALMEAVHFARFVPPTMLRAEIPLRLLEVLTRCVVRNPAARFSTAGEMARALERFISENGAPVTAQEIAQLVPPQPPRVATGGKLNKSPRPGTPSPRKYSGDEPPTLDATTLRPQEVTLIQEGPTERQPAITAPATAPSPAAKPPKASKGRWVALGVGAGVLVGVAAGFAVRSALARRGGVRPRSSIAVLEFQNLAGREDERWLSTALSEMVATELASTGGIRVIPGEAVARARAELGVQDALEQSPDTLARLRKDLGTDLVVSGAYLALGDKTGSQLRVDVRLRRATDGETLASLQETGAEAELPQLVMRLGRRLGSQLGLAEPSAAGASGAYTAAPEATRLYADGLAALRRYDNLGARGELEKAIAASPNNPLPYAALATAWSRLGAESKAAEMAKAALDRSQGLSREERLAIEARDHEMSHDWAQAQNAYRTLWTFFPDNVEYGLGLTRVQYSGGDGQGALATLAQLRAAPVGVDDPRVDLEEALAAGSISDYKRANLSAHRAAARAEADGSKLLQAQALLQEGWCASYMGDNDHGNALLDQARELCAPLGDRACVARALDWSGSIYNDQGDFAKASERLNASIELAREIGDGATLTGALNNLALVELAQGHLARARERLNQAVELANQLGQRRAEADFGDTLARVLRGLASSEALEKEQAAQATFHAIGDRGGEAISATVIGGLQLERGDPQSARATLEPALVTLRGLKMQTNVAEALRALAGVHEEQDAPELARRLLAEEAGVVGPLGAKVAVAANQVAVARLMLAGGKASEAGALAHGAIDALHAQHAFGDEVEARVTCALSALQGRKAAEARQALDEAAPLARASENPRARLEWAVASARVSAKLGRPVQALAELAPAVAEAHKLGLVVLELEARLAEAEIELGAGQRRLGLQHLQALNKDATSHGLLRLVRLSAALTRG